MSSKLTQHIAHLFDPSDVRLFVVQDADGILSAEESSAALMERGIVLIPFGSSLDLRYVYESRYRGHLAETRLAVVTRIGFCTVPLEILSRARRIELSLASLFPHLDAATLRSLPFVVLSRLYDARTGEELTDLSRRETLRLVAEKGYGIPAESVSTDASLYEALLRIHLSPQILPEAVADYVVGVWRSNTGWQAVPLERMVRSRVAFLEYLQQHWNAWVVSLIDGRVVGGIAEPVLTAAYGKSTARDSMPIVPWESVEVRTLVDDYFDMGLLEPVHAVGRRGLPEWAACGVVVDEEEHVRRRIAKLEALLAKGDTETGTDTAFWGTVAPDIGSLFGRYLLANQDEESAKLMSGLLSRIDAMFGSWVSSRYDASLALPYLPRPHTVHQIVPYLAALQSQRVALVVMDGMNWWQWRIIAAELATQGLRIENISSVLACIPTITSISRAAIFAGKLPRSFFKMANQVGEGELWEEFWEENGLSAEHARLDVVGPTSSLVSSLDTAYPATVQAFGAVVPRVDELIHNVGLNQRMFAAAVKTWAAQGELAHYLGGLLHLGYDVYVTADHGNTSAQGIGAMGSGVLAEEGSKRMRLFGSGVLRDAFVAAHEDSVMTWNSASLPDDVYAVLCRSDGAFAPAGEIINCHGGISLLEVTVPFARITGERP
jgi:hypothetical protein